MAERENSVWIADLKGSNGDEAQGAAFQDLGRYLWTVANNQLDYRQSEGSSIQIQSLSHEELISLSFDFSQDMLERIARNEFALLDKYREKGKFLSWMAVILHRHIGRELSRSHWQKNQPLSDDNNSDEWQLDRWATTIKEEATQTISPDKQVEYKQIIDVLVDCIKALQDRRRDALLGCIVQGDSAKKVATRMGRSTSSIFNLVMRAKQDVRACMEPKVSAEEVFEIFK